MSIPKLSFELDEAPKKVENVIAPPVTFYKAELTRNTPTLQPILEDEHPIASHFQSAHQVTAKRDKGLEKIL